MNASTLALHPLDLAMIAAYFGALVAAMALRPRGGGLRSSTLEYVLAGRRLTMPLFVATTVTTWYGGILGLSEYSYSYGLANWVVFGVPYYAAALLYAFWLVHRSRRSAALTMPAQLRRHYGASVGWAGALLTWVYATPAPYVIQLGLLMHLIVGWPVWLGTTLGTVLSLVYLWRGGLRTNVWVDVGQFALMFGGFIALVGTCAWQYGGLGFIRAHVPPELLTWTGGNAPQSIIVWFVIALVTLVDPTFHQRITAAESSRTARMGLVWSVAAWGAFDFMQTAAGLYARAILPHLDVPAEAYPRLATAVLVPGLNGLFWLAMLATVVSTISGYGLSAAVLFGHELMLPWMRRRRVRNGWPRMGIGLVVTGLASAIIGSALGSVVTIWHDVGSVVAPALLVPLTTAMADRPLTRRGAWACIVGGGGLSLAWAIAGHLAPDGAYPLGVEPICSGLALTVLVGIVARRDRIVHREPR